MSDFQSLTTLIKRLEAATSRLEDLATSGASVVTVGTNINRSSLGTQPVVPSSLVLPPNNDATAETEPPLALSAYDELIEGPLKTFVELSKSIGGLVEDQSHAVENIFIAQRDFIYIATKSVKPDTTSETFAELIKPTLQALEKVCEYRENNRPSPFFNHLSTVGEGIGALGWVTLESKTAPYVGDLKESSQFYANRVIKEFKDKDRTHVDWANSFVVLLTELQNYVKNYHTNGLVWNPQ
ncbi:10168_t:CDS:2, partial [Ambispora leptoticha]